MQAIVTKYLSPTDRRGTRIKASAAAKSITVGYQYNLNIDENHRYAALKLQALLAWNFPMHSGVLPNGDYAHVQVEIASRQSGPSESCPHCGGSGRVPTAGKPLPAPKGWDSVDGGVEVTK